jgi:hypothetical protein
MTPEQEFELRNVLGISADGDVIEAAKLQLGELTELKRNVDAASQEKQFAEQYPAYWNEHNKLMERDRDSTARQFSESVQRVRKAEGFGLKETQKGLFDESHEGQGSSQALRRGYCHHRRIRRHHSYHCQRWDRGVRRDWYIRDR